MNCKNCNAEVASNYCPDCGQPAHLKRINGHYILHEIEHVLHFEKGILYTIRELIVNPGENIKRFITENRSRLVKPIIFIIITSLIYSLVNHFFHIEDEYVQMEGLQKSAVGEVFAWIQGHYGYANILMGIFIALWAKIFYKRYGYNFFEILILLCFVMGMGMLVFAIFAIIQGLIQIELMQIGGVVGLIYCTWAIGQFFDRKDIASYILAFTAYMLGMITFFVMAVLLGVGIDWVTGSI